jgi:peroxiredoxin Q/BCP
MEIPAPDRVGARRVSSPLQGYGASTAHANPSGRSLRNAAAPPFRQKKGDIMVSALKVGDKAPDFDLPASGASGIKLSNLSGKKVVLYFYPKDDTSGCTKEAMAFNALRDKFRAAGAEIIGISADSVASHDKFRAKYELAFPLASDEDKTMLAAYGVWVEKSMYGRKYMGIERTTILVGADGRIARIWPKVKVPGHAEEVLEAVKAL